jgi:very-short-patch-repair endonuclease
MNRFEQDGWIVLRFWIDDVLSDIVAICDHILRFIGKSHL